MLRRDIVAPAVDPAFQGSGGSIERFLRPPGDLWDWYIGVDAGNVCGLWLVLKISYLIEKERETAQCEFFCRFHGSFIQIICKNADILKFRTLVVFASMRVPISNPARINDYCFHLKNVFVSYLSVSNTQIGEYTFFLNSVRIAQF